MPSRSADNISTFFNEMINYDEYQDYMNDIIEKIFMELNNLQRIFDIRAVKCPGTQCQWATTCIATEACLNCDQRRSKGFTKFAIYYQTTFQDFFTIQRLMTFTGYTQDRLCAKSRELLSKWDIISPCPVVINIMQKYLLDRLGYFTNAFLCLPPELRMYGRRRGATAHVDVRMRIRSGQFEWLMRRRFNNYWLTRYWGTTQNADLFYGYYYHKMSEYFAWLDTCDEVALKNIYYYFNQHLKSYKFHKDNFQRLNFRNILLVMSYLELLRPAKMDKQLEYPSYPKDITITV